MGTASIPPEEKKKIVICISGLAGSGKSTVARRIAEHFNLKYYSGGDALRSIALEMGYRISDRGWWETREGMRFLEERLRNLELDRLVDERMLKLAEEGNVVLDSWTMPWLLKHADLKVWLDASEEVRAQRISKRDGISFEEALKRMRERETRTKEIYRVLYGFRLGEDFEPFHVILNVDNLNQDEVFKALCIVIENMLLKKREGKRSL
ncbi:MAG: cytidylate kinase family protein [Candidatus Bathyarchaeota archaeon]|nr:cytidylate kinase family protein [Candidatus Bathyarchaeota archaeon]